MRPEWLNTLLYNSSQFKVQIESFSTVPDLLDRTFSCIWMIVHRSNNDLEMGDLDHVRTLIQFTLIHVNVVRHSLRPARKIFGLMAKSVIAGLC